MHTQQSRGLINARAKLFRKPLRLENILVEKAKKALASVAQKLHVFFPF